MISGENSNVLQYIILLSSISRECQDLLLGSGGEYLPRIKEVFDYLSYVPPTVTRALLAAVEVLSFIANCSTSLPILMSVCSPLCSPSWQSIRPSKTTSSSFCARPCSRGTLSLEGHRPVTRC
jgi:hypothetical protein